MKLLKIRQMGRERILVVPKHLTKKLAAEYMSISMDDDGRIIYTPVRVVA
jgi:hypothetical protein